MSTPGFALALHGGAGTIKKSHFSPAQEKRTRAALRSALELGVGLLTQGADALDVVEAVVRALEDAPMFNAGVGSVYTDTGRHELDVGIMRGSDLAAGAVCGVQHIAHPISLAKAVLLDGRHVLLGGEGAERFAQMQGFNLVSNDYFDHAERHKQWLLAKERAEFGHLETPDADASTSSAATGRTAAAPDKKFGTVGAVACDLHGHLAAATSTGGMTNKRWGRIGDTPIVGAGVYADDRSCAVSATGHGEYFIRACVAHDVAARMRYAGRSLAAAADEVVFQELAGMGGVGGLIAVDKQANIVLPFNSLGMYRAWQKQGEPPQVAIYQKQ
ncbi:MAG: hypothetical protein RLZZ502_1635 [Pseudomonadota bacterium]